MSIARTWLEVIRSARARKLRRWVMAAALLAVGTGVGLGLVPRVQAEWNWQALQQRRALRVGIDPGVAPFSYYDAAGWNGYDADVAQALAQRLQLSLHSDPVGYDAMYDALQTNRVDIVISAVVADPARTADFAYSTPYFDAGPRLVTALPVTSMPELAGRRVAVGLGSQADRAVRYWERRVPHLRRLEVASDLAALQALGGDADAALVDVLALQQGPQLNAPWCGPTVCRHISIAPRPLVIALRKADAALLDHINQALAAMQADGTLSRLQAKWMGPG